MSVNTVTFQLNPDEPITDESKVIYATIGQYADHDPVVGKHLDYVVATKGNFFPKPGEPGHEKCGCDAHECDVPFYGKGIAELVETELDADSPAPIPINEPTTIIDDKKPPLTQTEIRKLRRQFITVVHPRVAACGHKHVADKQPRHRNCPHCWFAWFQNHGELVQTTDELHSTEGGIAMILQLQGAKFLRRFRQFMSTIAHFKAQETQENHGG
jgi:hypothetical protein